MAATPGEVKIEVWRLTCPHCRKEFYEPSDSPLDLCPHCGAETKRASEGVIEHMYHVRIEPLTGRYSVSDVLIF